MALLSVKYIPSGIFGKRVGNPMHRELPRKP